MLEFEAAASAGERLDAPLDAGGRCLVAHYRALTHLTDPERALSHLAGPLELARASGDPRLVSLMEGFHVVADVIAGELSSANRRLRAAARTASEDGYDRFILHWAGWLVGLAELDAAAARSWMAKQQDYLDRTGIVETWITSYSTALCEVIEGADVRARLGRTLALAAREGHRADADCLLVLAYAEAFAGRYAAAAELVGTAVAEGFNATAHYVLYRAVLDRPLREHLDATALARAFDEGRAHVAADVLAARGVPR
jgi:hypothetical protein